MLVLTGFCIVLLLTFSARAWWSDNLNFCHINMTKIDQELFGWAMPTVYEILEM